MACWYWSGRSWSRLTWASCPSSTTKPNWATPWQGEKSAFNSWILPPSLSSASQVLFLSDTATLEYVSPVHVTCFVVWIACEMCQAVRRGHCNRMCLDEALFLYSRVVKQKAFLMWLNGLKKQFVCVTGMLYWPLNIFNKNCGCRLVCRLTEWLKEALFRWFRVHLTLLCWLS